MVWWPNALKLSDGGWRRKTWIAKKTPSPASVRWSALLGGAGGGESGEKPRKIAFGVGRLNLGVRSQEGEQMLLLWGRKLCEIEAWDTALTGKNAVLQKVEPTVLVLVDARRNSGGR